MFFHPSTAVPKGIAMTDTGNKITFEHEGQQYSATYTVDDGVVSVMMRDGDGTYRGTSTFVDGSSTDSVARSLLDELLRDIGFF